MLISLYAYYIQKVYCAMSLSPAKNEILAAMLLLDKPERATQIAKEVEKEFPSVMMHIIGLSRMGYVTSPEKGLYILTEKGRHALGINEITSENAKTLLADMPQDRAFNFYAGLGKPLNLQAYSLKDFCDKLPKVNAESVTFHVSRGDFSSWFAVIGDVELAKKTALLKEKKIDGEELRSRLLKIVRNRCMKLANVAGHAVSPE
jgi:hypothetical protein